MISSKLANILLGASILISLSVVLVTGDNLAGKDSGITKHNTYQQLERLDQDGKYWLEWSVNWIDKRIIFNATVQTKGYVAFGLSRKGQIPGADIVICGVLPNGTAYFFDRHALANQMLTIDPSQDYTLLAAWENTTHTFLSFSRLLNTCDENHHDLPITDESIALIWAYGETDDVDIPSPLQNVGYFQTHLLDPDPTPLAVKEADWNKERLTKSGNFKVWGIYGKHEVAAKDTTYLCSFHKAPSNPSKQHIVGFRPIVASETDKLYIHHFLIHRCYPPKGVNAKDFYEPFVGRPGKACYNTHIPSSIPTEYCREFVYAWGLGGKPFFLENSGIPINRDSSDDYYMLQIHYDNPDKNVGVVVNYGLEMFYTEDIRKHDAQSMYIGLGLPGSPSLMLPPGSVSHAVHGQCGGECTRKMWSATDGINIVAAVLHTHLTGVAVKLVHIRDGKELPPIFNDDNYMFDYQPTLTLREERTVLPGDSLIARCKYTTKNESAIVGGFTTRNEMCDVILWYYMRNASSSANNASPVYSVCNSEIRSEEYRNFLGIWNYTWSDEKLDNVVIAPSENAGLTTKEVGTRMEWSIEKRNQLQSFHKYLPHVTWCPDHGPEAVGQPSSLPSEGNVGPSLENNEYMADYSEDNVIPYQPTETCSKN